MFRFRLYFSLVIYVSISFFFLGGNIGELRVR